MTPPANSPSPSELTAWDRDHNLHPWGGLGTWKQDEYQRLNTGDGVYLWDSEGKRFIDGPGGMWCVQIGYGREEMAEAIADQVRKMVYASPWSSTSEPAAILARKIAERTPGDLNNVHYTTCGSTAVDTALRTVGLYNNVLGRPEKKRILSREKAYHGSTYLASSMTGKERFKTRFDKAQDIVHFLPDVNPNLRPDGMSPDDWCDAKIEEMEKIILDLDPDTIGGFIAEPILCSGGVIVPPKGYHAKTLELCRKYDILYISDEVVTGFGRLGHWFASETVFDIVPDMITCAKGLTSGYLPLGACIMSDRIMKDMRDAGEDELFYNGYTYSGHPVSCAAALKNMEIMEREDILGHVLRVSEVFQDRLHSIGDRFDIVGEVRGMGLLGCLECRPDLSDESFAAHMQFGNKLDAACERMGLMLRPFGNMAVFSPPLVISEAEVDEMFTIMEAGLEELNAEYNA